MTGAIKADSFRMAALPLAQRNEALLNIARKLRCQSDIIFKANAEDIERAESEHQPGLF